MARKIIPYQGPFCKKLNPLEARDQPIRFEDLRFLITILTWSTTVMSWLYGVYSTVAYISKPSYITDKNCGHSIVGTMQNKNFFKV